MKIVLQRVNNASVEINDSIVGSITTGIVAFVCVAENDDEPLVDKMVDKISRLKIFSDANGKNSLSSMDIKGQILVIPQFTLLAICKKNKPDFSHMAKPDFAEKIYTYFVQRCSTKFSKVVSGRFASHMHVYCNNDGPYTIIL